MLRAILVTLFGLPLVIAASGCDTCPDTAPDNGGVLLAPMGNCSQSMSKYESSDYVPAYADWSPSKNVTVRNHYGPVQIEMGGMEQGPRVHVSVVSFTYALWEEDALRRLRANDAALLQSFPFAHVDQQGDTVIDVTTNGEIGYSARVGLPIGFDGALTVTADRGDIEYWDWGGSSGAASNQLHSDGGDVLAMLSRRANLTIQAVADQGVVTFSSAFMVTAISPDKTRGSALLGNGAVPLEISTSHGDITFKLLN